MYFRVFLLIFLFSGCKSGNKEVEQINLSNDTANIIIETRPKKSKIAQQLTDLGLIDIATIDTFIVVDLKYATTDNFTGEILYEGLSEAFFQPDVATMLSKARKYLQDTLQGATLLVYDAARPLSIQKIMWEKVEHTLFRNYVNSPEKTGLHNYGAAVDLTIIDANGIPLDMGTSYDHFGRASGNLEQELVAEGLLNPHHVQNRQLLRYIMRKAGFFPVSGEWWHFNAYSLSDAKKRYEVIDT